MTETIDPIRPERNSMEVFLIIAAVLGGTADIVSLDKVSVEVLIGPVWFYLWASALVVGGIVILTGLFWPGRSITSMSIQQIGYAMFGFMALARSVALLGINEHYQAALIGAFATAAIIRLIQLERKIRPFYPAGRRGRRRQRKVRGG